MRKSGLFKSILAFAFLFALSPSAPAVSGPHAAHARITTGSGSIQAVLEHGELTVLSAYTAVIRKFQHENPTTGYHIEKLGENVYSVTQGIYMAVANGNGFLQIPAGE